MAYTGEGFQGDEERAGMPCGTGLAGLAEPSCGKRQRKPQVRARLLCILKRYTFPCGKGRRAGGVGKHILVL